MTIPDISADIPSFKKNLKRLRKLQNKNEYLESEMLKKSTSGVDLLNKSKMILQKAEAFQENNLDFTPPKNELMNESVPPKPQKISEEKAKIIAPKMEQISSAVRDDSSFTVPSVSPEENYAAQKYSRLMENYATGIKNEVSNYDNKIKQYVTGQKGNWLEDSVTEFGKWAAVEQFRTKLQKMGMTGALEWLADNIGDKNIANPYEYLETEEGSEFSNEFRDALGENTFYQDGYKGSLTNLYKTFAPQLYQAFVEESDNDDVNNRLITGALRDIPEFKNEELGKKVLKQAITEQLQSKYQGNAGRLAKQIGKYVDDNYASLKLNSYRTPDTKEGRNKLFNEFRDTETIQELARLQGYRDNEAEKLTVENIGDDFPVVINKLVAELRINPKFHKYSPTADVIAARMFGDAFEKYYDPKLSDSYIRSSPHYIRHVLGHVNTLIDDYNNDTPGNVRKIPLIKPTRKIGEMSEEDIKNIQGFFKTDGQRLRKYLTDKHRLKGDKSAQYLEKLDLMNRSGALSHMTDSKSHAAILLDNLLTENRGLSEALEKGRGKSYYENGVAFILDPRNRRSKLKIKGILNSPIFMDPEFLGEALQIEKDNLKSSRLFPMLVKEVQPLINGSYFKERGGAPWEKLAFEDYMMNPFVQRLRNAAKSPADFEAFLKFFNGALNDIGVSGRRELNGKPLFNSDVEQFLNDVEGKPSASGFESRRSKTPFEDGFFRSPDQHIDRMNALKSKNWVSDDVEIGTSVKVYAAKVYENFFSQFSDLADKKDNGDTSVEAEYGRLRQQLLQFMNRKVSGSLFEEKNDNPYNYFADSHDIEDDEIRNGVLEALYILKKFDPEFHTRLLEADANAKGVLNPDLQPKPLPTEVKQEQPVVQAAPEVEQIKERPTQTSLLPEQPKMVEPPVATAAAVEAEAPRKDLMNINAQPEAEKKEEPSLGDTARIRGQLDSFVPAPQGGEKKQEETQAKPKVDIKYKRRNPKRRIFSIDNVDLPPKTQTGKATYEIDKQINKFENLKAFLEGGVKRNGKMVDWEDATEDERRYTLFNALLATAGRSSLDGLNPISKRTKEIIDKKGLDSYVPRQWLETAMLRYGIKDDAGNYLTPEGKAPGEYKYSNTFDKLGLTEINPWNADSYIRNIVDADKNAAKVGDSVENWEEGEDNQDNQEPAKNRNSAFKFKFSNFAGTTGAGLYERAAMKANGDAVAAKITKLTGRDMLQTLERADTLNNYLTQSVAESVNISDDEKADIVEVLRNMQTHYNEAKFTEYLDDTKKFRQLVGDFGRLNTEPANAKDPYRETSSELSEEENYANFLRHPVIGNLVDKYGRVSDGNKQEYFNIVLNEMDKTVDNLREHITAPKRVMYEPTREEFKKTAVEYFNELDDILEKRLTYLSKNKPGDWERYHKALEDNYAVFKAATEGLDIDRANRAKEALEKLIPADIYDFHKALSGIIVHLNYAAKENKIDVANAEAKERKKQGKKSKKLSAEKQWEESHPAAARMEEEPEEKPAFDVPTYDKMKKNLQKQLVNNIEGYKAPKDEAAKLIVELMNAIDEGDIDVYKFTRDSLSNLFGTKSFVAEANDLFKYKKKAQTL
jgi:hypothetical protein